MTAPSYAAGAASAPIISGRIDGCDSLQTPTFNLTGEEHKMIQLNEKAVQPVPRDDDAHEVGTGVGAGSGALAGAVAGSALGGPVGALAGLVIGAVGGALAGREVAEQINPTLEGTDLESVNQHGRGFE